MTAAARNARDEIRDTIAGLLAAAAARDAQAAALRADADRLTAEANDRRALALDYQAVLRAAKHPEPQP